MASQEVVADLTKTIGTISPLLHGHFVEQLSRCVTDGLWDSKNDRWNERAVALLRELGAELIRWPGGCFADMYHWRDGIGPVADRPRRVTSRWGWDEEENNRVGTHEFMQLCEETGGKAWINGNVANGSVQEMVDWVEYATYGGDTKLTGERRKNGAQDPFSVPYWGIGNECWDCGGKFTPAEYAEAYRRYESSLPRFQHHPLSLIVCGPDGNKPHERKVWTAEVLRRLTEWRRPRIFAVDAHWYNWGDDKGTGSASVFTSAQARAMIWRGLDIETMIREQIEVIHAVDPGIKLIIGEWGSWHPEAWQDRFYQQVAMRDGTVASAQLDIFHRHCKDIAAATMTMACNVLSAPIHVREGVTYATPTYHAMAMHKGHRGQTAIEHRVFADPIRFTFGKEQLSYPRFSATVSRLEKRLFVTLTNLNPEASDAVSFRLEGACFTVTASHILAAEDLQAVNSPQNPENVTVKPGGLVGTKTDRLEVKLPAGAVVSFETVLEG